MRDVLIMARLFLSVGVCVFRGSMAFKKWVQQARRGSFFNHP
jgi:hypothetical protein